METMSMVAWSLVHILALTVRILIYPLTLFKNDSEDDLNLKLTGLLMEIFLKHVKIFFSVF